VEEGGRNLVEGGDMILGMGDGEKHRALQTLAAASRYGGGAKW
jgi:hypothetical protein